VTRAVVARILYGIVAAAAFTGVVMEIVTALTSDDPGFKLVNVFSFFTIQSNLLAGLAATFLVVGPDRRGRAFEVLFLDALLCIAVTGIVFHVALSGLRDLTAAGAVSNFLLHTLAPVGFVVAWLAVGPRPRFTKATVGLSVIYPLAWIAYTFARGAVTDWYPYPFLNVLEIGMPQALLRTGIVAVVFLVLAFAVLGVEKVLPASPREEPLSPA
jgi:hypothetical protein